MTLVTMTLVTIKQDYDNGMYGHTIIVNPPPTPNTISSKKKYKV